MIIITAILKFVENPPGNREQQYEAGTDAKLRCRVESRLGASIDWYKNGRQIDYEREDAVKEGYTIKFNNLKARDEGQYTCKVYNGYGSVNFTYTLTVTGEFACAHNFELVLRETEDHKQATCIFANVVRIEC